MKSIFIDTSAWIRLGLVKEKGHSKAVNIYKRLVAYNYRIYTSTYIIDEVLTRLITLQSFIDAKRFYEKIYRAQGERLLDIVKVDAQKHLLKDAWMYFSKYKEHKLSFTDAVSIAILKKLKLDAVFTFDSDFKKVGISTIC